jgi:hypothetical protein
VPDELPTEVRELIARNLASMEHVDVLLVLHRAPERHWSAAGLAGELHSNVASVTRTLRDLATSGLVAEGGDGFHFAPASPGLRRATELLLEAYNARPVTLVRAIYDRPPSAVKSFADAFRLKPDQ